LTDAVVVVIRYFGGTRLGVGGLVRAYGDAAAEALARAPLRQGVPAERISIRYPYPHTAAVMRALDLAEAAEMEHGFADEIAGAEVTATVPCRHLEQLDARLREQTSAEVEPLRLGKSTLYRGLHGEAVESA
jgi:putative IMPACT (imprinted ancient) family translation regulator